MPWLRSPPETADYVVVGAGSAGCVVASRLAQSGASVVLLEAGPPAWNPLIHVPAGMVKLARHPRLSWNFQTESEDHAGGRSIHWPRGRVLGGSGAINGMAFVRGSPSDYDDWHAGGCDGWSYRDVLPHFRSIERFASGDPEYRGRDGPLSVQPYETVLPLTDMFVAAAAAAGHRRTEDFNGPGHEGVGYGQLTRDGRFRATPATAFLGAASRDGPVVFTGAHAMRLRFEARRCVGVEFLRRGSAGFVGAAREVVLCAGTVGSPHLLQVSGIGPPEVVERLSVPTVRLLPGVGSNLIDHYLVQMVRRVRGTVTVNDLVRRRRLPWQLLRWAVLGRGPLTFGISTAIAFCRSDDAQPRPNLQIGFVPASYDPTRFGRLDAEPGMTVLVANLKPLSRGWIRAVDADSRVAPRIRANYLEHPRDLEVFRRGIREVRRILELEPIRRHCAEEVRPGAGVAADADLDAFVRSGGGSMYHPVGTCRMGVDATSVVDPELRVRGVERLRVADASIMPSITSGNTNAPTMMIGAKAAALVLADAGVRGAADAVRSA